MRVVNTSELLEEAERLEKEASVRRVGYYAKLLPAGCQSILDLGCGNGYAVTAWREAGARAIGVDISRYRLARWVAEHRESRPLIVADARHLPFRPGTFDAVISSGMIEHVGVRESTNPYTVSAESDQDESRAQVTGEVARVLRPGGTAYLDFPNGAFPIDFWHGDQVGSLRWHGTPDALLPRFRDVAKWASGAAMTARLEALTGRLAFQQVGRHWWGRWATVPMALLIRLLDGAAARGWYRLPARVYPYLVISLRRRRLQ
ncbi:MAG TPA: class I SAM-dependent methyltransferase [Thermoanaerobaculia bacterium]|nr:class I SAM-dependent methyltransferase [Thermoanaerobaculia bacterium]